MDARGFRLIPLTATIAFVGLAGSALAYVCHPNGKGTMIRTVSGAVSGVALRGPNAVFMARTGNRCSRVTWNIRTGVARSTPASCARVAGTRSVATAGAPTASTGRLHLTVVPGSVRRPATLRVYARNGPVQTLALPAEPRLLVAFGGLAVFSATRNEGLFAVRLADGLYSYLGPDGGAFRPLIGLRGALFHDGESKRALREGKTILKFVPRQAILRSIATTAAPLVVGGPIHGISMDGPRVALSVGDVRGVCDRVLYWNVAWRPVQRISAASGPTCRPGHTGVGIGRLAIGGFRTEWLTSEHWLVAGSPLCQEWVLNRGGKVRAMTGAGQTLAFAAGRTVAIVDEHYRPKVIAVGRTAPLALAADTHRVAILWPSGRIDVRSRKGRLLATIGVPPGTRRIALEGDMLVASRPGTLDTYSVSSAKRTARWAVPAGATGLGFRFGVAAFGDGRNAIVLDTRTGRTATVGHASAPLVGVRIGSTGLAYAYGHTARFVPTQRLVELLDR